MESSMVQLYLSWEGQAGKTDEEGLERPLHDVACFSLPAVEKG